MTELIGRRSRGPGETFVPSILNPPAFDPNRRQAHHDDDLWSIGRRGGGRKNPEWLTSSHLPVLVERSSRTSREPSLLTRSSRRAAAVLDAIDESLRFAGAVSA